MRAIGLIAVAWGSLFPGALSAALDARLGLDAGYDSSLFRLDVGALGDRGSPFLALAPGLAWKAMPRLDLLYAGRAVFYSDESRENHFRQDLTLRLHGEYGLSLQSTLTRVDGPSEGPVFDVGRNAWATLHARARRPQWQNRTQFQMRFAFPGDTFVRPVASLVWEDMRHELRPGLAGYDNWIDRHDLAGGFDFGRTFEDSDLYLGLRHGRQEQGRQGGRATDRSNTYHRALLGWRGPLGEHTTMRFEAGPSFHRYDDPASPGGRRFDHWYLDLLLQSNPTPVDRLTAVANLRSNVNSTGGVSAEVRTFTLNHQRRWNECWQSDFSVAARGLIYAGIQRKDWLRAYTLRLTRHLGENRRLALAVEHEEGRDHAATGQASRHFERTVASVSAQFSF